MVLVLAERRGGGGGCEVASYALKKSSNTRAYYYTKMYHREGWEAIIYPFCMMRSTASVHAQNGISVYCR